MKSLAAVIALALLVVPVASAQDRGEWPPLSYLRNDYRSVSEVAHIRVRGAEITGRIGGYENWRVSAEVVEPFKGRFRRGQVIEYFHGAEAGLKADYFTGDKIVFLLAEHDGEKRQRRYSVLENSTLPRTDDSVRKLRAIRRSDARGRARRR